MMQLLSNRLVCLALLALHCTFAESEFNVTEVLNSATSNEAPLQAAFGVYSSYNYLSDGTIGPIQEATNAGLIRVSNLRSTLTKLELGTLLSHDNFVVSSRKSNPFILAAWTKNGKFVIETSSIYGPNVLCGRRKIVGRSYNSKYFKVSFAAITHMMSRASRNAEVFVHVRPIISGNGDESEMMFLECYFNDTSVKNVAQISGNSLFLYSIVSRREQTENGSGDQASGISVHEIKNFVNTLLKLVVHEDLKFALSFPDFDVDWTQETASAVWGPMKRIEDRKVKILNNIDGFYLYAYDGCTNDSITDGGHDMYDTANKVEIWTDNKTPNTVTYNSFYRSSGKYEFLSSVSWPFTGLMYIENSAGNIGSFSIQVSGNAGADNSGKLVTYNGSFNLHKSDWTIKYIVHQVYNTTDPTICEVYFAVYRRVIKIPSFNGENSGITEELKSTVTLSNYPRHAWMGYTLLSRVNGKVILQEEAEKTVRILANEITATTWILEKIKCSTTPLIVQWLRTKHFLDPMYTMQIQDTALGKTTNTSVQFLISKTPAITMTEIRPAMPRFCSTFSTLSAPKETVVIEQKTGWVEGKLAAFSTVTHENRNGGEPFRVGILDVL